MFSLLFLFFTTSSCNHDGDGGGDNSSLIIELLTKSEPDECFCGIGARDNGPISNSITGDCSDLTPEEPLIACIPKRNHSYIWSMTKVGSQIWFGTLANAPCLGRAVFRPQEHMLENLSVCEFRESHVASLKPQPILGDHRTPKIMVYDTKTEITQEISVDDCEGGNELLDETMGLRQSGSIKYGDFAIVIVAGPSLIGGINMFAFDAKNNVCLAARNFPEYNDSRKTSVINGILYSTVGKSVDDDNPIGGGRVLRYRGDLSDPLRWEEVGKLDTIGANLAFHEGRIFVSTWPNVSLVLGRPDPLQFPNVLTSPLPGIFMGPIVPPGGLTSANFNDWVKVWETTDYETDLVTAGIYSLGGLESFQGSLWWGTINVPFVGFLVHAFLFEPDIISFDLPNPTPACASDPECLVRFQAAIENSERLTVVFRGRNFDSTPEIELLYGESSLPAFNSSTGRWEEKQNNGSLIPLFGNSGIGNSQNIYNWSMAVFGDRLYAGTLENSPIIEGGGEPDNAVGADLFRFSDLSSGAEPVSLDGLGNFLNFGIRVLLPDEDGKNGDDGLYIGTANPFNLAPDGGWELLRLK